MTITPRRHCCPSFVLSTYLSGVGWEGKDRRACGGKGNEVIVAGAKVMWRVLDILQGSYFLSPCRPSHEDHEDYMAEDAPITQRGLFNAGHV